MTFVARLPGWLVVLLAAATLAAGVQAAVTWTSQSTVTTDVRVPPAAFEKGSNAENNRYFKNFELSTNQTSFTAEVKPRAGADTTVTDVLDLVNAGGQSRSVTLSATQVSNEKVEQFEWRILDGGTLVATVDYLSASPQASFTLPASTTYTFDLRVDLADGAGNKNAGISFDLQLEVTG